MSIEERLCPGTSFVIPQRQAALTLPGAEIETVWTGRQEARRRQPLFAQFDTVLRAAGDLAMGGQIADATSGASQAPLHRLNRRVSPT